MLSQYLQALLGSIYTVGMYIVALVVRAQELMKHLIVMNTGIRHHISPYQFVLYIHTDTVLEPCSRSCRSS